MKAILAIGLLGSLSLGCVGASAKVQITDLPVKVVFLSKDNPYQYDTKNTALADLYCTCRVKTEECDCFDSHTWFNYVDTGRNYCGDGSVLVFPPGSPR